jgi:hypothetical protein
LPRFYASDEDLKKISCRLYLTVCPLCKRVGTLILHDWLYGYADDDTGLRICRGRRVLCTNRRKRHPGCGHTFSIWIAETVRRSRVGALKLWAFLKNVLRLGDKANALRTLKTGLSISSAYRVWQRFLLRQSYLRTALSSCCPPPSMDGLPVEETIAHLEAAFPDASNPIVAFQQRFQIAFL